jgi:hypothetical protein
MAHYKSLRNGKKKKISSHINCLLIFCILFFYFAACRVPSKNLWKNKNKNKNKIIFWMCLQVDN